MIGRNSMLYWYPLLAETDLSLPETIMVLVESFKEEKFMPKIRSAIEEIGLPAFIRTDHFSGKHHWNEACYLDSLDSLESHIKTLVVDSSFRGLETGAFAVREFLQLEVAFHVSIWNDMPVAKERRYFVGDGQVLCHHPYWDAEVFHEIDGFYSFFDLQEVEAKILLDGWQRRLKNINHESQTEIDLLTKFAESAGSVLRGAWSVDFASVKDDGWVLIDCALAKDSWHPSGGRESSGITCPLKADP